MLKNVAVLGLIATTACAHGQMKRNPELMVKSSGFESFAEDELVVVDPSVIEGFQFLYRFITEIEFVLCLEGTKRNGRLFIDGFRLARMEAASFNSVRYLPCTSERYIGTAHNHPPNAGEKKLCYQSDPDRRSFGMDPRAIVDVVLCGDDKYLLVLKDGRYRISPPDSVREKDS